MERELRSRQRQRRMDRLQQPHHNNPLQDSGEKITAPMKFFEFQKKLF